MNELDCAVIGGGAAGFFGALNLKVAKPNAKVALFEKGNKLLSKVKLSGGGRCNVTHDALEVKTLAKAYPRGSKALYPAFKRFAVPDTIAWFEKRGVALKTESDGRMFPTSDRSQTIMDCFLDEARRHGITLSKNCGIRQLIPTEEGFRLLTDNNEELFARKVLVATGGSPKLGGFAWLADLGHRIVSPVPSLFTFNMPKEPITELMGLSAPEVESKIIGTKLQESGPLLITHWGMSGPAILKLSAWGAQIVRAHV